MISSGGTAKLNKSKENEQDTQSELDHSVFQY